MTFLRCVETFHQFIHFRIPLMLVIRVHIVFAEYDVTFVFRLVHSRFGVDRREVDFFRLHVELEMGDVPVLFVLVPAGFLVQFIHFVF